MIPGSALQGSGSGKSDSSGKGGWSSGKGGGSSSNGGPPPVDLSTTANLAKEDGDGNDDGDGKRKRNTLRCSQCKESKPMQELLLRGTEWQSELPLCCFNCQDEFENQQDFGKEVQKLWKQRKNHRNREKAFVRTCRWESVKEQIDSRYEGESRKEFRKRLCEAFYMAATLVGTAYDRASPTQQARMVKAFQELEAMQASVPTYVPDMDAIHADFWSPDKVTQYVDMIVEGINEHFLCRRVKCLRYTLCARWIENGSHYKCPSCGCEYKPWSDRLTGGVWEDGMVNDPTGGRAIDAQKIMVCTATEFLKGNEDVDDIPAGTARFYLVRWADTNTEILKNRLKETFLDLAAETHSMSTTDLIEHIRPLVMQGRNDYMTKVPFSKNLRAVIDEANKTATKQWKYDHIADGFLMGQADADMPIMSQATAFRMWAFAKYTLQMRVQRRG